MHKVKAFFYVSLGSFALAAAFQCGARSAQADVIDISPAQPTDRDTVTVTVRGCLAPCWAVANYICRQGDEGTLEVEVYRAYNAPICIPECAPYHRTCQFGPLAAGWYTIHFWELPLSPADPLGELLYTTQFKVTQAAPTIPGTWGHVKAIYR